MLGSVLFLVCIKDLVNLESTASVFTDDTKIHRMIKMEADIDALRRDMTCLDEWSRKWLLSYNVGRCKIMHIGHHNQQTDYQLNQRPLQKTTQE